MRRLDSQERRRVKPGVSTPGAPLRAPLDTYNDLRMLRIIVIFSVLTFCVPLFAQQGAPGTPNATPKNLKILPADATLMDVMQSFNEALGVQCVFCHAPGDFASEANPRKETARKMIAVVREVEPYFPSTAGVFPRGYHEVDCMTCHRGGAKPETKGTLHFLNRRDASGAQPDMEAAVNLTVLPKGTRVHGAGSIMEDFRDALNVDCSFCHGGGVGQEADKNPRKDVSRRMIEMQRKINANFPGTGVYPDGPQAVTCYTCHHADVHPASLSNKNYPPMKK